MEVEVGNEVTKQRHQNHGLRKVCACPRARWPRCPHAWRLNFKPTGEGQKHYRISLDQHAGKRLTKTEADALADRLRDAIRSGTYPPPTPQPAVTPSAVAFKEFGQLWINHERKPEIVSWRSDQSRVNQLSAVLLDDGIVFGKLPIGRITADDLETAFRRLDVHPRTLTKYLQVCINLQRWGVKKGYLANRWFDPSDPESRPADRVKHTARSRRLEAVVVSAKGKTIRTSEEDRLLAAAKPWLRRLVTAALETAMRRGELLKLQWRHVDLARGQLRLPAEICAPPTAPESEDAIGSRRRVRRFTKTAKGRTVFISAKLRALLETIRTSPLTGRDHAPTAFVFGNDAGEPVIDPKKAWQTCVLKAHGYTPVWERITASGRRTNRLASESRAQIATIDLHFHDLRHEAASRWLEAGMPLHHIQHLLGHSSLQQTAEYLNATAKGIEDSMRRYDEHRGLVPRRPLHSVAPPAEIERGLKCNDESTNSANSLIN